MSVYPTSLDTFTTHATGDVIEASYDNAQQVAISALETKVGVNSSAVTTTMDYKLSGIPASDKAVSLTGTEDLTNKSLKTGTKITLGSDATGDIYYRHTDGTLKRLAVSTDGKILRLASGVPSWDTETTVVDSSYAAKGVVEFLTNAATSGITIASGIANVNMGTSANQIVQLDGSAKLPAVDGSALTNIILYKNGADSSRAGNAGAGTQNIAHGLGRVPKKIKITALYGDGSNAGISCQSFGAYDGTTNSCAYIWTSSSGYYTVFSANTNATYGIYIIDASGNYERAIITVDTTNIILTWTINNGLGGNVINIMWEAEG
jgi:hypothetical protein